MPPNPSPRLRPLCLMLLLGCLLPGGLGAAQQGGEPSNPAIDAPALLRESSRGQRAMGGYQRWDGLGRPPVVEARAVAAVGDERTFHIYDFEASAYREVSTTLRAVGDLSHIWVEEGQFGPGKVTAASLDSLMVALEEETPADPTQGILPLEQGLFGEPPDVDGSGVVHIVITDIQDSYTEGCGCSYVAGFFDPVDLDPEDPDSDMGDILYVDAFPGIYGEEREANAGRILGTLAHEYQHLIHASYGQLPLFQNEGQSEWATLVTGYGARIMEVLTVPEALNTPLFSWGESGKVAYDYERSGLLSAYLAGQVGPEAVGAITRAEVGGRAAYEGALSGSGRSFEEALADFYLALWANDGALGSAYHFPQEALARVGMPWASTRFEDNGVTSSQTRTLAFGGGDYLQWIGVEDVTLTLSRGPGLRYGILAQPFGGGSGVVQGTLGGDVTLPGAWESLLVVPINTLATGDEVEDPGSQDAVISAAFTDLGLDDALLRHYDPTSLSFFVALPRTEDQTRQAVRLSPYVTGEITELLLGLSQFLDGSPNPVGTGALRIQLAESVVESGEGAEAVHVPGEILGSMTIPFEDLGPGLASIDTRGLGWMATAGEERQLVFEVVGEGAVYFNLDGGSGDTSHPDYYPARTRRWQESEESWDLTWANNGNIVVAARVLGDLDAAPDVGAPRYPKAEEEDIPLPLRLAWYPLLGASSYDIQLAEEESFAAPLLDVTGVEGTWLPVSDIEVGASHVWRVRGVNAAGAGPWSEAQRFKMRSLSEGGETLSYLNQDEIYWAVTLPFEAETGWSLRFTPYATGSISALGLRLSVLEGLENPAGEGRLTLSLHGDAVEGDPDAPDSEHRPGAEIASITLPFSSLEAGLNTIAIPDWPVEALVDQHIVLRVESLSEGAGLTFDLDNGDLDIVDVAYYPARTRRDVDGSGAFEETWLNNGNIGVDVIIGAELPQEEALSYYDPDTLFWYGTLPFGDETAAAYRISPTIDGVLGSLDISLTTFLDGSSNPTGDGSLIVELWESAVAPGVGTLYVPGRLIGSQAFSLDGLSSGANTLELRASQWALEAGGEYHVVLRIQGDGQVSIDLDNGSEDVSNTDYYPARTLRYWESTGSWDQQWLNNGNLALSVTVVQGDGGSSGCSGGEEPLGALFLGLLPLGRLLMGRRRQRTDRH